MLQCIYRIVLLCLFFPISLWGADANTLLLKKYKEQLYSYRYTKYLDSSIYYYRKALPIALLKKDSVEIFCLNKWMGDAYEHHQYLDSTLAYYDVCNLFIPYKNYKLKSFLLNDKAYTYRLLNDHDQSALLLIEAHRLAELSGEAREISNSSLGVAEGYAYLKMNKLANQYYEKALSVADKAGDRAMYAQAARYYGTFKVSQKEFKAAGKYFETAESFYKELADSVSLAYVWDSKADYYWELGKADSSFYFAKKAEKIWGERVEYIDYSAVCLRCAKRYLKLGKIKEAGEYLKKAAIQPDEDNTFLEDLYATFGEYYSKTGNLALAYENLFKAKELSKVIREQEFQSKQMGLRIKFGADQKEIQLKEQRERNKLAEEERDRKTQQRNSIFLILIFVFITAAIVIFAYVRIKKKNKELKVFNEELELSAEQKLLLLKEVHHRVKNNLTTLKSLFYLQAKASNSEEIKSVLEECQLRIESMALIHQNLYEESSDGKVEFGRFINQLFNQLELSFRMDDKEVNVITRGTEKEFDMSIALFLGMILNELATNSFKYAFSHVEVGEILVDVSEHDNKISVIYSDNGPGLSDGFDIDKSGGFGFKLIRILSQQLDAKIVYSNASGVSQFIIEIDKG